MGLFDWFRSAKPPAAAHAFDAGLSDDSLMDVMVDRNLEGMALEKAGDEKAATQAYEANVRDRFDGSHPYERLMIIYSRTGAAEDAKRVARACLLQATAGQSEKLKARCEKVLAA